MATEQIESCTTCNCQQEGNWHDYMFQQGEFHSPLNRCCWCIERFSAWPTCLPTYPHGYYPAPAKAEPPLPVGWPPVYLQSMEVSDEASPNESQELAS